MPPTLAFDEIGIILATMTASIQMLYFVIITLVNGLGILVSDIIIDKKLNLPDGEFSWREVGLLAVASSIITMSIISIYAMTFWYSLFFALIFGLIFRPLLPELAKIAQEKITSVLQALFGKI